MEHQIRRIAEVKADDGVFWMVQCSCGWSYPGDTEEACRERYGRLHLERISLGIDAPCAVCQALNIGSSPTGSWCNSCGWAYPGYICERCGREGVNEYHIFFAEGQTLGTLCHTTVKKVFA